MKWLDILRAQIENSLEGKIATTEDINQINNGSFFGIIKFVKCTIATFYGNSLGVDLHQTRQLFRWVQIEERTA